MVVPAPISQSNVSAHHTANNIRQKYKDIRQNKGQKLLKLRRNEQIILKIQIKKTLYLEKMLISLPRKSVINTKK